MKIIVLATDSDTTWMMVNALRADYPALQVALETPVSRALLLKRRAARIGPLKVGGQMLFMLLLPLLRRSARARLRQLEAQGGLERRRPDVPVRQFDSVNSAECIAWLAAEQPDAVVLNGTRIISSAVLAACGATYLNTHCGITPAYRGVHGGYWALYNRAPEHAGVTVHVVDAGIDTGDIVHQAVIQADADDNFTTYPVKQYIAGVPLMKQALAALAQGRLARHRRDDLASGVWQHPTLWQYLAARWTRGVR